MKLYSYIKLSRPINALITFLVIIVASIISIEESFSEIKILLAALSGALTAMAGNVINDYFDVEIDKINKPERVLPSGKLSLKAALSFYIILSILALLISSFISINAFMIVFTASLLLSFYSYQLKKVSLVGNVVVSFLTGLAFIYGGLAVNNVTAAFIPALFAFLINFIREIVKDMEDLEGDKLHGINSFPVSYGFKKAKVLIAVITIVLIILTTVPFIMQFYKIEYFIVVMVLVNPVLVYIIKSLFENDSVKNLNKLSNLLKLNMVLGLIAISLGK
jgi:geranylgeranylglycerol-phosphate geranylgeranyltransferase